MQRITKRAHLISGDRVADSYTLSRTGTVFSTGRAMNSAGESIPTARVLWDGDSHASLGYGQDTLTLILSAAENGR